MVRVMGEFMTSKLWTLYFFPEQLDVRFAAFF